MKVLRWSALLLLVLALAVFFGGSAWRYLGGAPGLDVEGYAAKHDGNARLPGEGWPHYGNDAGGHRYSSASHINVGNVAELELAWEYSSGDLEQRAAGLHRAIAEATPILAGELLVYCTPFNDVIALDPGTGEERWRFDSGVDLGMQPANEFVCRGVAHWQGDDASGACASRILTGTNDARLIALDARTGVPCPGFGDNGEVAVDIGMELLWPGEFQITSAPVIVGDTVVIGSAISDNVRVAAPYGVVRAYDVRTGELVWDFDPIPREAGDPDWQGTQPPIEGHANAWAPMSVDEPRGLVFVPTSSPSPDFYGGLRPGDNRHANSVVALDAEDGSVRWAYQLVHHDVWDYDLPAQPGLYAVWRNGAWHDVVAQVTKTGHVFVLDRDTGEPYLPVTERPIPGSDIDGEALSATQPIPDAPPQLVPSSVAAGDAYGITWFDKRACDKRFAELRAEGLYTPPSRQGSLFMPFTGGGANWGGAAYDPQRNLLIINMSNLAHIIGLLPIEDARHAQQTWPDDQITPMRGTPFAARRGFVLSPFDLPCNPPPWGIIAAIDLADGDLVWRRPIGSLEDLTGWPAEVGTPTYGGPIATAGDVIFIASTMDYYLRALSTATGEELWRGRLPTSGTATPMTYVWQGRQYVVIFAGGSSRMQTPPDDRILAFALPQE